MRVLVIGAGVAGLTVAHELAVGGAAVTVVEKTDAVGRGASGYAGGMLAPWCESESADEAVLRLGRGAAAWWRQTLPGLVEQKGTLVVAPPRDSVELDRFAGCTTGHVWLDAEEIEALEPDLGGRFRKGLFFAEEAHLDPRAALECLYRKLSGMGVRFHFRQADGTLRRERFDARINCTGIAHAGNDRYLRGVRGEMLHLRSSDVTLSRPVRLLHPRIPVYVVPRPDGLFMVGATMIESDAPGPITARSMMELLNAAYVVHPAFGEADVVETGTGIRPAYPDNFPRVTRIGDEIVVNGLYRHGFLLSPTLAGMAARMVFEQPDSMEFANEANGEWSIA